MISDLTWRYQKRAAYRHIVRTECLHHSFGPVWSGLAVIVEKPHYRRVGRPDTSIPGS